MENLRPGTALVQERRVQTPRVATSKFGMASHQLMQKFNKLRAPTRQEVEARGGLTHKSKSPTPKIRKTVNHKLGELTR